MDGFALAETLRASGGMTLDLKDGNVITTTHNEKRFDAYYFVDEHIDILGDYYELKPLGNPV